MNNETNFSNMSRGTSQFKTVDFDTNLLNNTDGVFKGTVSSEASQRVVHDKTHNDGAVPQAATVFTNNNNNNGGEAAPDVSEDEEEGMSTDGATPVVNASPSPDDEEVDMEAIGAVFSAGPDLTKDLQATNANTARARKQKRVRTSEEDTAAVSKTQRAGDGAKVTTAVQGDVSRLPIEKLTLAALQATPVQDSLSAISFRTGFHLLLKKAIPDAVTRDTFINLYASLNNKEFNSLSRLRLEYGRNGVLGAYDKAADSSPAMTFDQVKALLAAPSREEVSSHAELIERLKSVSHYLSNDKEGKFYLNNVLLFSVTDRAYIYKFDIQAMSQVFNSPIKLRDTLAQFQFMLFLVSNGQFSLYDGIVHYVPEEIDAAEVPSATQFVIDKTLYSLRGNMLKWCVNYISSRKFTSLDRSMVILDPPACFSDYCDAVSEAIDAFYKPYYEDPANIPTIIGKVLHFSQYNKGWRSRINQASTWFLPTPEFDYQDVALNLYSKKRRNKILFGAYEEPSGPLVTGRCYEMTGLGKEDKPDIRGFSAMHAMWAPNRRLLNLLPNDTAYEFTSNQAHSLDINIVPVEGEVDIRKITKEWYCYGHQVFIAEVQYMKAMLTGRFTYSGVIKERIGETRVSRKTNMGDIIEALNSK
jgi:hypothetical protein